MKPSDWPAPTLVFRSISCSATARRPARNSATRRSAGVHAVICRGPAEVGVSRGEAMAADSLPEKTEIWLANTLTPNCGEQPEERAASAALVHGVFGSPFRPASLAPRCRAATVQSVARPAYEERVLPTGVLDCDRLAVLADALEDVGSAAEPVEHLRGRGRHDEGDFRVSGRRTEWRQR